MNLTVRNKSKRFGANLALAIALMGGTTLGSIALEAPANAQKDEAAQPQYSKSFREAYNPVNELVQGDAAAQAQAKAQIPALLAALETPDDRNAAGGMIYNLGVSLGDRELQYQGMRMMLDSGKVPAENIGRYNMTAYQISNSLENVENAREHLEAMIAADYSFEATMSDGTTRTLAPDDLRSMIATTYFEQDDLEGGLQYLKDQIEAREAANGTVPEAWITRGLATAYEGDNAAQAIDFADLYVAHYPSKTSWGDALAIHRNLMNYNNEEILDLLRLGLRTNSLREERDYAEYVEMADAIRLPGEVKEVVDQGIAAGIVDPSNTYLSQAREEAASRIEADRGDLASYEAEARAANAKVNVVTAAADAFLMYDQPATAEELYKLALDKPGVERSKVLTRLGIAQTDQGKGSEAVETFAKVEGTRAPIARLWMAYAAQLGSSNAAGSTSAEAATAPAASM